MSISPVMQNAKRQTVLKGAVTAGWPWTEPAGFSNLSLRDSGQCACRYIFIWVELRVFLVNMKLRSQNLVQCDWSLTDKAFLLLLNGWCWLLVISQQMAPDVWAGSERGPAPAESSNDSLYNDERGMLFSVSPVNMRQTQRFQLNYFKEVKYFLSSSINLLEIIFVINSFVDYFLNK